MYRVEFGADGIRGRAGEWPFVPPMIVNIGHALGQFVCRRFAGPLVVIGHDTRPSGAEFAHYLTAGLTSQGVHVINIGVMTTPGVAFLTRRQEAALGIVVSASHNPLEYNGLKLVKHNGLRLQREEEIEVESLIDEFAGEISEWAVPFGKPINGRHLIELYIQDHAERCPAESLKGLRVVLDCANGAASEVAPEAFKQLGAEVAVICNDLTGQKINHRCGSEHAREHPQRLIETMRQHNAAYGFAFDGDGDRVVVVDADGWVFDGHDLLFALAKHFQSQGLLRGDTVVTIHQANRGLEDALHRIGVRTSYTNNGDRYLEDEMWSNDYLLGGEPGGNIIINDGHHTAADAIYTALVLGGVIVCNQGTSLGEMTAPLQKRPQVTVSFELPITLTLEQMSALREQIRRQQAQLGADSRILIWDSSTEPGVYRVMAEGCRKNTEDQVTKAAGAVRQLAQRAAGLGN